MLRVAPLTKFGIVAVCAFAIAASGAADPTAKDNAIAFARRVLDLTNQERAKLGLQPLRFETRLTESARWKAEDMAKRNYFDHADGGGRDFIDRAQDFGYKEWHYLGENIAAGQSTPEEVVAEWMASPGHRRNILKREYREIGIAFTTDSHSEYGRYWVQEFGSR